MLQHGAASVLAVDTGYGQIDARLRADPRVRLLEKTNARYLEAQQVPEPVEFIAMDVSFISATQVLPAVMTRCVCRQGTASPRTGSADQAAVRSGPRTGGQGWHRAQRSGATGCRCQGPRTVGALGGEADRSHRFADSRHGRKSRIPACTQASSAPASGPASGVQIDCEDRRHRLQTRQARADRDRARGICAGSLHMATASTLTSRPLPTGPMSLSFPAARSHTTSPSSSLSWAVTAPCSRRPAPSATPAFLCSPSTWVRSAFSPKCASTNSISTLDRRRRRPAVPPSRARCSSAACSATAGNRALPCAQRCRHQEHRGAPHRL